MIRIDDSRILAFDSKRRPVIRKDPKQLAVALIDSFEGAVLRAKAERSRATFENFQRCVLPCLLA